MQTFLIDYNEFSTTLAGKRMLLLGMEHSLDGTLSESAMRFLWNDATASLIRILTPWTVKMEFDADRLSVTTVSDNPTIGNLAMGYLVAHGIHMLDGDKRDEDFDNVTQILRCAFM